MKDETESGKLSVHNHSDDGKKCDICIYLFNKLYRGWKTNLNIGILGPARKIWDSWEIFWEKKKKKKKEEKRKKKIKNLHAATIGRKP